MVEIEVMAHLEVKMLKAKVEPEVEMGVAVPEDRLTDAEVVNLQSEALRVGVMFGCRSMCWATVA